MAYGMVEGREIAGRYRFNRRRMKEIRIEAGMERRTVAEKANIGVATYEKIEQGQRRHPSAEVVISIAAALDTDPLDLFEPAATGLEW